MANRTYKINVLLTHAIESITITKNPKKNTHDEVYSIQHYVIKFVSDLRQVAGFLRVLPLPPPIKLTVTDITEILLKLNLITLTVSQKLSLDFSPDVSS